jgi:tellurite resistance protein TerC
MLDVSAAGWAVTIALIAALLAGDIALSSRRPHAISFREAMAWSVFYVTVAVVFGVVFGFVAGWDFGAQYFAG